MQGINIFKIMEQGAPHAFNAVFKGKSVFLGVSKMIGKWPYADWSNHPKDELLIVLKGVVEVDYQDGKKVLVSEGEIELMKKNVGHKVSNAAPRPAETMLIFLDESDSEV